MWHQPSSVVTSRAVSAALSMHAEFGTTLRLFSLLNSCHGYQEKDGIVVPPAGQYCNVI